MSWHCRIAAKVIAKLRAGSSYSGEDHTMRYSLITGLTCAALVVGLTPAAAQTLMGVPSPAVPGSAPADAAAAPEATAPKPKQKGPPGALTVVNASAKTVTEVAIT